MTPLWTPNRKVLEPVPVCPRCGGYDRRRWPDRADMRRYLSTHRICCCAEPTCEDFDLSVVVSGVDATYCSGCYVNGSRSIDGISLSIDGTYTGFVVTGTLPNWTADVTASNAEDHDDYPDGITDCSGSPSHSGPDNCGIRITGTCTGDAVFVIGTASITVSIIGGSNIFQWSTGSGSMGDTLNNGLTPCGGTTAATGGTCVVNLA